MSQFNLIDNRPESLLDTIHEQQVKVLARGPVFKGLLTSNSVDALDKSLKDGIFEYTRDELVKPLHQLKKLKVI